MKRRVAPGEKLEQELYAGLQTNGDPFGEAARRGAQLILQRALEVELDAFLGRGRYERAEDGAVNGYRNGYEAKKVHMAEGTVELKVPQVRESLEPFELVWLQTIGKRASRLLELIPMPYVKGMSQRDNEDSLVEVLGVEDTGHSVITEVCKSLRGDLERWQNRDLGDLKVLYLFLDGISLKLRPEDKRSIAVLCAYGILWDGKKVLLHLAIGDKESAACWEAFVEDMRQRGLTESLLAIVDDDS